MTMEEAIALLRTSIPDFTHLVHSDLDLTQLLEQAANEVAALTLCYEKTQTWTEADDRLKVGQREYLIGPPDLSIDDAMKVLSVHVDGFPLTQITPEGYTMAQLGGTAQGEPRFWYEFAGRLGLRPTPSQVWLDEGYFLEITYAARVGAWNSGESPLPNAFDEMVIDFAYTKALMREGQWQEGLTAMSKWLQDIRTQPIITQRPATQHSGPPMSPTQRVDARRQRR